MAYDDDPPDLNERAVSERVQAVLEEMHATRQEFLRSLQAGMLTQRSQLRMQSRLLDVVEELRPYRKRAKSRWQSAGPLDDGLQSIEQHLQPREQEVEKPVGFGRTKVETEQIPTTMEPMQMITLSQELDEIAEEIGFEPAPDVDPGEVDGGII